MDGGRRDPDAGRRESKLRAEGASGAVSGKASGAATGGELAGIGIQFAAVILVFAALGVWLDRRFGSSPLFTLVFVFVGAAGGFYSMYRKVMAAQRRDAQQVAERRAAEQREQADRAARTEREQR